MQYTMIYFFQSLRVPRVPIRCLQAFIVLLFFIASTTLFSDIYRIKIGDTLLIAVIGQPEYTHSVQVREDGRINYFGGDFDVAGQTVTAVNQLIREFLVKDNHVSNPIVMVSPVFQESGVFVGGAVKAPGRYPISPETDIGLYRAIALAGGMAENADRQGVQLIRTDATQKVETYDLSTNRPYKDIRVNINDLVFVMPLNVVEVQGQVQTPGKFFIRDEIGIEQALARAGGPTPEADLTALIKVGKDGTLSEFNRSEQFWKSTEDNTPLSSLSDGDVLYVPNVFKVEPIYVTGYVRNPGAQRVRGPLNLSQAVALAGGFEVSANREEMLIHRRDGTTVAISLTPDTPEGTTPQQVLLYPGDILEIKKEFQVNWGLVSTFAYILISGIGIIIQLTR
ncbi:MAG: SLBB domain-containing protein [Candidatus Poribacteria bacterium]|nr:SLBB domain-containing protein [Candidatus Poribacteria bacterium]